MVPGAGQPDRLVRIQHRAAQDHSGSDYPLGVLGFLDHLSRRTDEMELPGRVCLHYPGGVFHLTQVVEFRPGCITTSHPGESKMSDPQPQVSKKEIHPCNAKL